MKTNGEVIADQAGKAFQGELISALTIRAIDNWLRGRFMRDDIEVRMWPGSWLPQLIGTTPEACAWLERPHIIEVEQLPPVWPQAHRNGGS